MVALPAFYVDNVRLLYTDTLNVRGNTVSDCYGSGEVIGIEILNANEVRAKNNKVVRLRTDSPGIGFSISNCTDVLMVYNVASRCDIGFSFEDITTLNVYNLTSHDCGTHVRTDSSGLFRNVAMSAFDDHKTYRNSTGFFITGGAAVNIDYMIYTGLSTVFNGTLSLEGNNISEDQILYMDEPNDDLTPDFISQLVNAGTDNPLRTEDPCLGGIESIVTDEITAQRPYYLELLDNSFWDIENDEAAEVSYIKAFQSRILANCEVTEQQVERDYYVKSAESTLRFSELYPMYARYANQTKFKKRVMDMWYAGQNPATLTAYNNSIGGYNLFPSYFKRIEDVTDGWIINVSYVNYDNWLLGMEGQKYGIVIDVLGLSTLSQSASAECYNNVQRTVSDIAPVRWQLHHEPEPPTYRLFTDLYNSFENCVLVNMIYNDDFNISPDIVQQDCAIRTPLISTEGVTASGIVYTETGAVSGATELSVLDRVYSETVTRRIYYRQGNNQTEVERDAWTEITRPIGEVLSLTKAYVQFWITATEILRQIDYEFLGLCLRPYSTARLWELPQPD
jgi:uncharacterized protein YuzE